ncbi:DUF2079 domain-containing protein [Planktothrix agardhii 1033]|nr:DUF2079 domain-containing protein [Planktothrix agardhii 1033]
MILFSEKKIKVHPVLTGVIISSLILFACSSLRHFFFQSNAYDLGIFDNGIYLISQGKEPFVYFRGLHILGDHAAYILYIIALFYKIYPDIHWLFAIQAICLSLGALPTYQLSLQAGLKETQFGYGYLKKNAVVLRSQFFQEYAGFSSLQNGLSPTFPKRHPSPLESIVSWEILYLKSA